MINVIIPVAGKGTRLGISTPKCMVDINGYPCIDHIIRPLARDGFIRSIALVVNPQDGQEIVAHVQEVWGKRFKIDYAVQDEPLGLGHAYWTYLNKVAMDREYTHQHNVLFINGDTITKAYHIDLLRHRGYWLTVTPRGEGVNGHGIRCMSGYLRSVTEEGQTALTCAGMYFFKHAIGIYEALSTMIDNDFRVDGEFQLADAIDGMIGSGFLFKYNYVDKVYDIGTPERLALARQNCFIKEGKP